MTTYYVDPAAAGSNNGSDWTNAWTSLQSAADAAAAGDIVYCRGTQTLSGAAIDFDTNAGTHAAGWIKFIGCNASGNVDGTRFIIDANGGSHHCTNFTNAADMIWIENIEVKNTGAGSYDGFQVSVTGANGCVFINCCANTCGRHGFTGRFDYSLFYRCVAYSNGTAGFYNLQYNCFFAFCVSRDNTTDGFFGCLDCVLYGCIAHGNRDDGVDFGTNGTIRLINCVIDGNTDDGIVNGGWTALSIPIILGCRITNHSGSGDIGLNANNEPHLVGHCYFENNDGANMQNAGVVGAIPLEGGATTSNIEDQSNTNQGYVDPTNHDFSTGYTDSGDPDLRRTAITIPWS